MIMYLCKVPYLIRMTLTIYGKASDIIFAECRTSVALIRLITP